MNEQRSLHLINATGAARTETFDGREHLVVPVVCLIGDNVIHAVNAPSAEWVPASTLSAQGWDGRPLVLGHPAKDGRQISANDPRVIEAQGFGFMAATHVKDKKLGTEAWMDVAKLEKLGQHKMLQDARDGKPIEVSVGAFVQTRSVTGKSYKSEWATMAPDHLAFLPGGTGACSVEMGCGANRAAMRVCDSGLELIVAKSIIDPETLKCLRDIPQSERDEMSSSDFAGPDESFPIKTQADVDAAKHLVGKAADPDAVKAKIKAIAKRKGLTIPDAWQSKAAQAYRKLAALIKTLEPVDGEGVTDLDTDDDDPDEAAETISYEAMRALIEQAKVSLDEGSKHVDALIADNGAGDSEEVEDAHLEALVAMCVQLYGTTNGVIKMATSCLAPEGATSPMAYMEQRAAAGARHNANDQKIVQDTHDAMVQLGADCPSMKAAASACGCGGSMNRKEAIEKILAAGKKDEMTTEEVKALEEFVPEATITYLATLAAKSPADAMIQAHHNASAALAAHGHAMNMADETAAQKKAAADKKKAEDDKSDDDQDGDSEDVRAAKANRRELKAAEAAGQTVEEYRDEQWLKTAPKRIRDMAENDKAVKTARKATLVKALKGGKLTDKQLEAKPLEELETLASYAGVETEETADYSGRGLPRTLEDGSKDVFASPPNGYDIAIEKMRKTVN